MTSIKEYLTTDKDELELEREQSIIDVLSDSVSSLLSVLSRKGNIGLSKAGIVKETYKSLSDEMKAKIESLMSLSVWFEICITILSVYELLTLAIIMAPEESKDESGKSVA